MMDCERGDLLIGVLEDELDPDERREVEAHLESCAVCRETLEAYRAASAAVREAELPEPSQAGRDRAYAAVLAAMGADAPAESAPAQLDSRPAGRVIPFFRLGAAAAALLLVVSLFVTNRTGPADVASAPEAPHKVEKAVPAELAKQPAPREDAAPGSEPGKLLDEEGLRQAAKPQPNARAQAKNTLTREYKKQAAAEKADGLALAKGKPGAKAAGAPGRAKQPEHKEAEADGKPAQPARRETGGLTREDHRTKRKAPAPGGAPARRGRGYRPDDDSDKKADDEAKGAAAPERKRELAPGAKDAKQGQGPGFKGLGAKSKAKQPKPPRKPVAPPAPIRAAWTVRSAKGTRVYVLRGQLLAYRDVPASHGPSAGKQPRKARKSRRRSGRAKTAAPPPAEPLDLDRAKRLFPTPGKPANTRSRRVAADLLAILAQELKPRPAAKKFPAAAKRGVPAPKPRPLAFGGDPRRAQVTLLFQALGVTVRPTETDAQLRRRVADLQALLRQKPLLKKKAKGLEAPARRR